MERKLNIKVLLPEEVIEKYDIDEDTGVLSYFEDGAIHILIEDEDEMPEEEKATEDEVPVPKLIKDVQVYINGIPVLLEGKSEYIFVDIFDFYAFDLNAGNGREIITKLNGENAQFTAVLKEGDRIELAWKEF